MHSRQFLWIRLGVSLNCHRCCDLLPLVVVDLVCDHNLYLLCCSVDFFVLFFRRDVGLDVKPSIEALKK